jgi:hypothetical protein
MSRKKQNNIVTSPDTEMHLIGAEVCSDTQTFLIQVRANIREEDVDAVLTNWLARVTTFPPTPMQLVEYINSKSAYGFKAELISNS